MFMGKCLREYHEGNFKNQFLATIFSRWRLKHHLKRHFGFLLSKRCIKKILSTISDNSPDLKEVL